MTKETIMNEPAFPFTGAGTEGMTLRDYFAAKAMQSCLIAMTKDEMAVWSYEMADAMLKARDV